MEQISYVAHESMMARMERTIKRLWILCIILIVLLVGSNVIWVVYENSFVDEIITQEVMQETDSGGTNLNVLNMGD